MRIFNILPNVVLEGRMQLAALVTATCLLFSGCAAIQQAPHDPGDSASRLKSLAPYFDGRKEDEYNILTDDNSRTAKRNEIVTKMMEGYDIEFARFENQLSSFGNGVNIGTDLVGLVLGGLTATVGGASTKAALGAASVGVLGANTAINKDLFFQKTLPALKSQMEANRSQKELPIDKGLMQPDSKYPLTVAYRDLRAYRDAGRLDDAISALTKSADDAKQSANDEITFLRTDSDIKQLPAKLNIQKAYKALTDSQVLALAKLMQSNLAGRPSEIQALVKNIDPTSKRLTGDVTAARDVLNAWIGEEDMNSANEKQWTDAIKSAAK